MPRVRDALVIGALSFASLNNNQLRYTFMLQFTHLLLPISDSAIAGEDMMFSAEVDAINKARQFDDPSLDQGEWVVALKEADWPLVHQRCMDLLASRTKDLRLAAWLVEAAAKTHQFEGMAAGFELLAGLCERYWPVMYPAMEDGDIDQRVGNLTWLLTRSVSLVKEIPLTHGEQNEFCLLDFERARARSHAEPSSGDSNPNQPDLATLEAARRKSPKSFYESLSGHLLRCTEAVVAAEKVFDGLLGLDGPSFTPLKDILATVSSTVERFGADVGMSTGGHAVPQTEGASAKPASTTAVGHSGPVQDRAHALRQLREVADFFRRTEPHSPVAYLADKAASWGDMPLHTWLKTMVKDANSLSFIEEVLGVKANDA